MNAKVEAEVRSQKHPRTARRWWTAKQVAAHYNVSVRALANWVADGKIAPPVKAPNGRDNLWADEVIAELDHGMNGEASA
jgi:predicted site-specific integrase-resolvase